MHLSEMPLPEPGRTGSERDDHGQAAQGPLISQLAADGARRALWLRALWLRALWLRAPWLRALWLRALT